MFNFPPFFIAMKIIKFDHSIYRLVIRNIQGYGTFSCTSSKRPLDTCPALDQLKQSVLDYLLQQQNKRKAKPINWSIAWQIHAGSGLPHLDILIVFQKNIKPLLTSFDYLIKDLKIKQKDVKDQVGIGHVWVTPYSSKKLSKAVLDYGQKEDPKVLTNLTSETKDDLVRVNKLEKDPYRYLELQMLKDPLKFNLEQYVRKHDLAQYLSGWSSIKTKLKDMQVAAANLKLRQKPGFRLIDRSHARTFLTTREYKKYTAFRTIYNPIITKLNEIVTFWFNRPFKTKQLLLVGPADTGKTSLIRQIQKHTAVYHMDVSSWFPAYRDGVYPVISWNQFKLKGGMTHTDLLKFLEGYPMDLQYKGGSSLRRDNQLIIMTSNMTLDQHIQLKFKDELQRSLARQNLRARIEQVVLPKGIDLFLLQKLIVNAVN